MAFSIDIGAAPEGPQTLALKRANRRRLIAGTTGAGNTVTLQGLTERFAHDGVSEPDAMPWCSAAPRLRSS